MSWDSKPTDDLSVEKFYAFFVCDVRKCFGLFPLGHVVHRHDNVLKTSRSQGKGPIRSMPQVAKGMGERIEDGGDGACFGTLL